MIAGLGSLHWATLYDEDDEPYGETCACALGKDHDEDGSFNGPDQDTEAE